MSFLPDKVARLRLARTLYRDEPKAPVWAITIALLFDDVEPCRERYDEYKAIGLRNTATFRRMLGPIAYVPCSTEGCDGKAYLHSRQALLDVKAKRKRTYFRCPECEQARENEREASSLRWEEYVRQREERIRIEEDELQALEANLTLEGEERVRFYELLSHRLERNMHG